MATTLKMRTGTSVDILNGANMGLSGCRCRCRRDVTWSPGPLVKVSQSLHPSDDETVTHGVS